MATFQMQIRTLKRSDNTTHDDEDTGRSLTQLVRRAIERGGARPCVVMVRKDRIDLVDIQQLVATRTSLGMFIAGLTRSELPEAGPLLAVGVMGRFALRRGKNSEPVPVAMVFLEWSDCRWWHWKGLIAADTVNEETETLSRAVDGLGKPGGLGGWWSIGRRKALSVRLEPNVAREPDEAQAVH